MKRRVAAMLDKLSSSAPYLALSRLVDRLAVWRSRSSPLIEDNFDHIVVPTRGRGNIGDQAMLDSFLENVEGDVLVVVDRTDDFTPPAARGGRTRFLELPHFIYGRPRRRFSSRARLLAHLRSASTLTVVGADVMDGAYNRRESILRSHLVEMGAAAGVKSQLLGFSWNAHPDPAATRALARAAQVGRVNVRDPESVRRLRSRGIDQVEQVADAAFLLAASESVVEFENWASTTSGPIVVLNTSGLIARSGDFASEYLEIVAGLRQAGRRVVVVPHVIRSGDDDLTAARPVMAALADDPDVFLIDRLLSPAEISSLVQSVELVVTGRMHLAILALNRGVPAIVLATQGKVEGLLELFGLGSLAVEPRAGFGAEVLKRVRAVDGGLDARSLAIAGRERARDLARGNFVLTGTAEP